MKFFNCSKDKAGTRHRAKQKKKTKIFKSCHSKNTSLQKQLNKGIYTMSLVCKVCCNSLTPTNEARLREIKKGSVNVNKYADGVVFILPMSKNILKLKFYLIELRANTLVALYVQPQMFMSLEQLKRAS